MIPVRPAILASWLFGVGFCSAAINIACVGDSITAGVGVSNPTVDSYPARLQGLLGTNYIVQNDGVSGTTLLKQGDMPYWNTSAYVNSLGRSTVPNIVIIMLGTNDSKPQNWIYGTNFVSNYNQLIASYQNLKTNPRILVCTPPPVFNSGNFNIDPGIVATNISPLIRQIGTNLEIQVIDMQTLLAGHGEWFPDNVHPNVQGTAVMAAIVYTALLGDTMNGSIPNLGINVTNNNATLNWPAGGAGWVLQSTPSLGSSNIWTITSQAAINDGTSVTLNNPITGSNALFRLWNPSL